MSVVCTNYNKGTWISEAIESFLRQETNFKYEILLIDDKSTDGSQDTIKEYAQKYPDSVRAFYNKKNLGITKTWIKICKEAKGKYIARCDGDDFWIDNKKLQMQVDLLESNGKSKWCGTDCDIISTNGEVVHQSAFESGFFHRPTSYAEMFVTKGITAPSTWLIDAGLIREINSELNPDAVDDTFNIQLDLFNMTEYSYISNSTAVYRINEGSDSRPKDKAIAKKRDERLMQTQIEYLEKYKNVDTDEILIRLLQQSVLNDEANRESHNRLQLIHSLQSHISHLEQSVRDGNEIIKSKDDFISQLLSSRRYRIGSAIVLPISIIKSRVKKRK